MDRAQLLRDPFVFPSQNVLLKALGHSFDAFSEFSNMLRELNMETEWRYYNDSKAWLGKNTHNNKTVFWLSVWEGFIKVSLFFTEKTCGGIAELPVEEAFKTFEAMWAKLMPIVISVRSDTNLDDLFKVIQYKRNLK